MRVRESDSVPADDIEHVAAAWARTQLGDGWVLKDLTQDGMSRIPDPMFVGQDGANTHYRVRVGIEYGTTRIPNEFVELKRIPDHGTENPMTEALLACDANDVSGAGNIIASMSAEQIRYMIEAAEQLAALGKEALQ